MTKKRALKIMFFILGVVLCFHILIIMEIIPFDKVWAGKLSSVEEMRKFELFSILFNLFILLILFIKNKKIENHKNSKIVDVFIWIIVVIFSLNTIGNLFSKSWVELVFGTLLTLICACLCYFIVRKEKI